MRPVLYIVRGIPGSGKSTLARRLVGEARQVESDQFFISDGAYKWVGAQVKEAREWCFNKVKELVLHEQADVAVSSTSVTLAQIYPYIELARKNGYYPVVIECHSPFLNTHNVPKDDLEEMINSFEALPPGYLQEACI